MLALPLEQPSERRLSDIDRFCIQTREAGKIDAARRVRFVASTLGVVCMALLVCLGLVLWQGNAVAQERDALVQDLRVEREARIKATLAASDAEMGAASAALDTQVRGDIVDQRMLEQERRSVELAKLANEVERQRLIKANCITPRSIITAGL